jgi:hypothetical protein
MNCKITFFFENSTSGNGWQEVYYTVATDLNDGYLRAGNLYNARKYLMGKGTVVTAVRVNDDANSRFSTLTPYAPFAAQPYLSDSDIVSTTAMMRLYASAQARSRPLYLRGIPDDAFNTEAPANADHQQFLTRYANLGNFLTTGGWLIKARPHPVVGTNTVDILAWATTTPSTSSVIQLEGVSGVDVGGFLQCYKVKGLPFSPGLCEVLDVSNVGGNDVVKIRYRTPQDYVYPLGGYAVVYSPLFFAIDAFSGNPRFTRRATGRPFDVTRGRRRSIAR